MNHLNQVVAPKKRSNQIVQLAAQARLSHYRREAQRAAEHIRKTHRSLRPKLDVPEPPLVLIALWDRDLDTLRDFVEMASDWGPFEVMSVEPVVDPKSETARKAVCRFQYHGDAEDRDHHETELRAVLRRVTHWERPASDSQNRAPSQPVKRGA